MRYAERLIQAFVIYCFFGLLVEYLSGENEIVNMLRERPPTPHVFPLNLFLPPMDLSDPYTFLWVKRGVQRALEFLSQNMSISNHSWLSLPWSSRFWENTRMAA